MITMKMLISVHDDDDENAHCCIRVHDDDDENAHCCIRVHDDDDENSHCCISVHDDDDEIAHCCISVHDDDDENAHCCISVHGIIYISTTFNNSWTLNLIKTLNTAVYKVNRNVEQEMAEHSPVRSVFTNMR